MTEDEMKRPVCSIITLAAAVLMIMAVNGRARAASQQFDCVLTDTKAKPGSEKRPVAVVFDEDAKTLTAKAGDRSYSFAKVTMTYIAISGQTDDASIGVDRSALGIVWQQYAAGTVTTEFGHCLPATTIK
jgi:hypothetical protein